MLKPFAIPSNRELVEQILTDNVTLTHRFSDRYSQDILEALIDLLREYDEMKEEFDVINEMERHIAKLEAMLDRRKVRYKKWGDVY